MNILTKRFPVLLLILLTLAVLAVPAFAAPADTAEIAAAEAMEETANGGLTGAKAFASALAIGLASVGGAVGMGIAVAKSTESVARQPEAEGKIRTTLMLGLVFIETAIIYALLAVILIIFVL